MKPIKWNNIDGFDGWQQTLASLLDAAKAASAANDDDERLDICEALTEFVSRSEPNTPEILELDRIASDAVQSMTEQIAADAVGRIAARTTLLTSLAKQVQAVADKAEKDASSLRLTQFHAAIDALTEAQRAVAGLDDVFKDGTDDELRGKIAALLDSINKARTLLDKNK